MSFWGGVLGAIVVEAVKPLIQGVLEPVGRFTLQPTDQGSTSQPDWGEDNDEKREHQDHDRPERYRPLNLRKKRLVDFPGTTPPQDKKPVNPNAHSVDLDTETMESRISRIWEELRSLILSACLNKTSSEHGIAKEVNGGDSAPSADQAKTEQPELEPRKDIQEYLDEERAELLRGMTRPRTPQKMKVAPVGVLPLSKAKPITPRIVTVNKPDGEADLSVSSKLPDSSHVNPQSSTDTQTAALVEKPMSSLTTSPILQETDAAFVNTPAASLVGKSASNKTAASEASLMTQPPPAGKPTASPTGSVHSEPSRVDTSSLPGPSIQSPKIKGTRSEPAEKVPLTHENLEKYNASQQVSNTGEDSDEDVDVHSIRSGTLSDTSSATSATSALDVDDKQKASNGP